jgi:hypothetical protein
MKTSIQVVWSIGLGGALVATLAILKVVTLVLGALKDIHRLVEITREAAQGLTANAGAVSKLANVDGPANGLRDGTGALASAAQSVEHKLDALAEEPTSRSV